MMNRKMWKRWAYKVSSVLIAYLAKFSLNLIMLTCRLKVVGQDKFLKAAQEDRGCILMLWHNRLALVAPIIAACAPKFKYAAFISQSKDAEPLAILANSYPNARAIRVAHNKRHLALKEMIQSLKDGKEINIITPDGPRGPKYRVKKGIAFAAKEAAANVVPLTWYSKRCWRLNTWDQLILPKPFSTIHVSFGDPILPRQESLKELTLKLEGVLSSLQEI